MGTFNRTIVELKQDEGGYRWAGKILLIVP